MRGWNWLSQDDIFKDNIRIFLEAAMAFHVDEVVLAAAVFIFLVGVVLLYKKGLWLGLPICGSSILLTVVAAPAKLFSV